MNSQHKNINSKGDFVLKNPVLNIRFKDFLQSYINPTQMMIQKGTTLDHDFYVIVCKQCRNENAYAGHQHHICI